MLARHYQKSKGRLQKKIVKIIKTFLKKRKTKSVNMFGNGIEVSLKKKTEIDNMAESDIKVYLKMKNKGWFSIEKVILKCGQIKPIHK